MGESVRKTKNGKKRRKEKNSRNSFVATERAEAAFHLWIGGGVHASREQQEQQRKAADKAIGGRTSIDETFVRRPSDADSTQDCLLATENIVGCPLRWAHPPPPLFFFFPLFLRFFVFFFFPFPSFNIYVSMFFYYGFGSRCLFNQGLLYFYLSSIIFLMFDYSLFFYLTCFLVSPFLFYFYFWKMECERKLILPGPVFLTRAFGRVRPHFRWFRSHSVARWHNALVDLAVFK